MKRVRSIWIVTLAAILIAACGAEPAPTMSVADVEGTAVSAALTIVAQTQAAIPTNTPVPPTETPTSTPLPTDTPPIPPTIAPTNTLASAGGDYCATRVLGAPKGQNTIIKIDNTTKWPVRVSLYLNETVSHNECGYRVYDLSKNGSVVITDLVYGCYNLWAWSTDPKHPFNSASPTSCINNPDKWTFQISESAIKFIGP
jgi:hypothetical protein